MQLQDCGEQEATLGSSLEDLHSATYLQLPFKLPTQVTIYDKHKSGTIWEERNCRFV